MFDAFTPANVLLIVAVLVAWGAMMAGGIALVVRALGRNAGGGWGRLRARYPVEGDPEADHVLRRRTVQVGRVVLNRCATLGAGPRGLWLGAPWRRPVLIPWGEIGPARPTRLQGRAAVALTVGEPLAATLTVAAEDYAALRPYLDRVADGAARPTPA